MNKQEILQEVINYFDGDGMAANVWIDKYAMKTKEGDILERTPSDMHHRLAKEFARVEKNYPNPISEEKIFELLDKFKYIVPQGSPMVGVGNSNLIISLSNCFVIGNKEDSYGGILHTDQEQIQLGKRRGGVGHDLSHLRPSGAMANNSTLTDLAGASLYAQRYSNSTKEVRQGDRRGALMLTMLVKHPDAERFIDSKLEEGKVTDANMSVKLTNEFMNAVMYNFDYYQTFPVDLKHGDLDKFNLEYDKLVEYSDENGNKGYIKKIRAKKLWDKIIYNAWKSAEPGVLFWDHIIEESPADCYEGFETISTNPCGEIPLCAYDSCRLLLMNLYSYVVNPFTELAYFDLVLFEKHVVIAQRLMDDLVDLEIEKIHLIIRKIESDPELQYIKDVEEQLWWKILNKTTKGRRTGLGITGEGDMLAALNYTYGSENAIEISTGIHRVMATFSYISSIQMAEERGSFSGWSSEKEKSNPFIERVLKEIKHFDINAYDRYYQYGRRNISNLTISPAGTTSIVTQTSSGVEPVFLVSYKRRRRTFDKAKAVFIDPQGEMFEEYQVFHHKFEEWYDLNWFKTNSKLYDIDFKKPLDFYNEEELVELISKSPYHLATSADINWESKVALQGSIQKWVDHSISATTNIPKNTTVETVNSIFLKAYTSGCKGMTIYREGSRSGILLSNKEEELQFGYIDAIKRPRELDCDIYHKTALKQEWMILVGKFRDRPYEIFAFPEVANHLFPNKINKGKVVKVKSGVYKLVGVDPDSGKTYEIDNIISLIDETGQTNTRKFSLMLRHNIDPKWIVNDIEQYALITSFDKVIQRVLKNYMIEDNEKCKECGGELTSQDGCVKCISCGWAKCS